MPAGDAHTIGRYIGDSVERSITLHCAQKMKSYIEKIEPTIAVLLSRKAGEISPFLQNAHIANCIPVDVAISIHCFQETEARPNFFIYTYKDNASFIKPTEQLMFYPYYQAYLFNQEKTARFTKQFTHNLASSLQQPLFTIHNTMSFPALPLAGIVPIAFMIEMGIANEYGYELFIQPICDAIIKTFAQNC